MSCLRAYRSASLVALLCAVIVLAGGRHGAGAQEGATPSLSHLEVDILPEFDQPAAVLVIMRAEISAEATLPAPISLRIPASSGGPSAVAEAVSPGQPLLNLPYETAPAPDGLLTVTFQTENRVFHVEYYDPIRTASADRAYRYTWLGDLALGQLTVQLQEPATASEITVSPDLGTPVAQADGLFYQTADLGPMESGKTLDVNIGYQKSDSRTSVEILGLDQSASASDGEEGSSSTRSLIIAGVVVITVVLAVGGLLLWRRRPADTVPTTRVQRRRGR